MKQVKIFNAPDATTLETAANKWLEEKTGSNAVIILSQKSSALP
jgi:hypothetical protein